jgi:hypothetical protein
MEKAWLGKFEANLTKMVSGVDNQVKVRENPGVIYVIWQHIEKFSRRPSGFAAHTSNTVQLVDKLIDQAVIGESIARSGLKVPVRRLFALEAGTNEAGDPIWRIHASIGDIACTSYAGGYAIMGEKLATWRSLAPHQEQHTRVKEKGPEHGIVLGTISSPEELLNARFLSRLQESLPKEIELQPVKDLPLREQG